ncbi:hypothetical protein TNCV_3449911 [Trichonephila clavipes]|nr:hypothetical protein TNCV_3449911 [Trichonephila clavipes]
MCVMVDHSGLLTTPKDDRANRYINEIVHLKRTLPGSVPLEHLAFCFRGKFCHLAQGKRGLVVPYIGNNTENVVFQMVKRLWLIRIDQ